MKGNVEKRGAHETRGPRPGLLLKVVAREKTGLRRMIEELLDLADIRINGPRPFDVQVHRERLFQRVLVQGPLGLGEAYMDGDWDCEQLDEFFFRVLTNGLEKRVPSGLSAEVLKARILNLQTRNRAFKVGRHHYDIGNDLFGSMLDSRMIYSCGYWKTAGDLDQAQEDKLDLVCRKLRLEPGMRVLDIGCGWGGTARFMAERYQAEVVGITVSAQQAQLAREACRDLPVEIRLQDYREVEGTFDRIVSIGMFEHVGSRNYRTYMETAASLLDENGVFLLQTIGCNRTDTVLNPWTARYIFPNSALPSPVQITQAIEGLFLLEDWHSFGHDYDRTLMSWNRNFDRFWPALEDRYDERFRRMWRYYLLSSAGGFRAGRNQLWQVVLSPGGLPQGHLTPR